MAFGIPPLLNKLANVGNTVTLLVADAKLIASFFSNKAPQWGVYLKGKLAVAPDNVVRMDSKNDWHIANYPMEEGAFQSYNKVKQPREVKLRMNKGGNKDVRQAFLTTVANMAGSLNLYDVVMPEGVISNMAVQHNDFNRTPTAGVGMITMELWFVEIMASIAPAFSNTAQPSGATPAQGGIVQAATPTPAQSLAAGITPL